MLENFSMLLSGLTTALTPYNLMACIIGGVLGIFVGALPGIGAVAGCSLLLPITYKMDPTAAIIMLAGIYYGNMFGGAYSAILLNIPGTPASASENCCPQWRFTPEVCQRAFHPRFWVTHSGIQSYTV